MSAKYQKLVEWSFNGARLQAAIAELLEYFKPAELAQLIGVTPTTISHWKNANWTDEYSHPNMSNFLIICNELDLDPREFFSQEDV